MGAGGRDGGKGGGRRQGWGQGSLWGAGEGRSPRQVSEAALQTWLFLFFFFLLKLPPCANLLKLLR